MNIIVFDLEWNQMEKRFLKEDSPTLFEIIEMGAIKLNKDWAIESRFSSLIKPQIYPRLNRVTENLIHIHMKELKNQLPFPSVYKSFSNFCGEDYLFATWGSLDLLELQRNMDYYHLPPLGAGPIPFLDVQKLYSIAKSDGKSRITLEHAVEELELEKDIPFHRAFSDAYYTAKVLQAIQSEELLKMVSYDTFHLPHTKKEEIKVRFPGYEKYITREFAEKTDIMHDREVASTRCYICHKNIKKKLRFECFNGKHYTSIAYCPEHGYFRYKVRLKKTEKGTYYGVKTAKQIPFEDYLKYKEEREKLRALRKQKKKVYKSNSSK